MSNRGINLTIPIDLLKSEDMIKFAVKTNGFGTLIKYNEMQVTEHNDILVQTFIDNNYIVAVAKSDELNMSIGVSRKGLVIYHKMFEKFKVAKVYSKKFGYLVILGKKVHGIGRFFLGDPEFFQKEISKIEKIHEDVSDGNVTSRNVSQGNTEYNNISKEHKNTPVRRVKKLKKIKDTEKENKKENILDKLKRAEEKTKREKEEYQTAIDKRKNVRNHPSQKKIYVEYKHKDVKDWDCEDFLGYYLNTFVQKTGVEDVDFINVSRANTKLILMNMGKFKQAYFPENNKGMKDYIEFAFDYILDPETWVDPTVSVYSLFVNKLCKTLVKTFLLKGKTTKGTGRIAKDNDYSDEDYWNKKYLTNDEK